MKKGFTLIELMVVISIIGILSAIAIPRFMNITKDAKIAQIQANKRNLETAFSMLTIKEDREIKDLFENGKYSIKENEFNNLKNNYMNGKIPSIPTTGYNNIILVTNNDLIYEDFRDYGYDDFTFSDNAGWAVTNEGRVYPVIREEDLGIRFDKF
ncbi:prepilin-type N-terminal cleavage/methylation domain-containing protein [Propionigenium maris DSM 9537]|uniref:Prepilin-type N-terminal cleavage/methylation domain-containing protein n=1 Tax=Propionigenium maris DSM 9537 TaxID=1123000 RepID=A0A9W6LN43_9FUSO|nr:type II secretion system protein [Propionigenium maris]GLI56267.1 prepilin-type N-terminal cleavage/methylation domain-containing protein [Propionigenium maris DSM 9537]